MTPHEKLDAAMREFRAAIDADDGLEPRVITGWVALWTTVRYDDQGQPIDGWNYSIGGGAGATSIVGTLTVATNAITKMVEGPP